MCKVVGCLGSVARAFVVVVCVVVSGGCSQWNQFISPDVAVADLRLDSVTLLETTATIKVRIGNENPEPMVVEGGAYELEAAGRRIGKGLSSTRLEIPPYATAVDTVALHLSNVKMVGRLTEIVESERLAYRLTSRLRIAMPYGQRTISTRGDGEIDVSAPPRSRP